MSGRILLAVAVTLAAACVATFFGPKPGTGPKKSTPLFLIWVLLLALYPLFLWFRAFDVERSIEVDGLVVSIDKIERPSGNPHGTEPDGSHLSAHVETNVGGFDVSWPSTERAGHVCLRLGVGRIAGPAYVEEVRSGRCPLPPR
jgi:hypothetical protein